MKTVIEMAREAGLYCAVLLDIYGKESALCDSEIKELRRLERFAALVRADEREACVKVCTEINYEYDGEDVSAAWIAAAIRARGEIK